MHSADIPIAVAEKAARATYEANPMVQFVGPVELGPMSCDEYRREHPIAWTRRVEDARHALAAAWPLIAAPSDASAAILLLVHTVATRGGEGQVAGVKVERLDQDGTTPTMRHLAQARGDLAAQEGITALVRRQLAEAHTSLLTAVDGNAPLVKRAEAAEAAMERVRALADQFVDPADPAPFGAATAQLIRDALDGGKEAGRASGGPVTPGTPLVGTDGTECFVPGVHVHRWQDQTTHADRKRQLGCTVEGCGEEREEAR